MSPARVFPRLGSQESNTDRPPSSPLSRPDLTKVAWQRGRSLLGEGRIESEDHSKIISGRYLLSLLFKPVQKIRPYFYGFKSPNHINFDLSSNFVIFRDSLQFPIKTVLCL